jgi:hypothetical protein
MYRQQSDLSPLICSSCSLNEQHFLWNLNEQHCYLLPPLQIHACAACEKTKKRSHTADRFDFLLLLVRARHRRSLGRGGAQPAAIPGEAALFG